jgi:hypothetical protein
MLKNMLKPTPPMSNYQRQKNFRLSHPGYYGRLHARQRAGAKAAVEAMKAQAQAAATPAPTEPLMLPAPVVDPMMLELNALAEKLAAAQQPVAIPAERSNAA